MRPKASSRRDSRFGLCLAATVQLHKGMFSCPLQRRIDVTHFLDFLPSRRTRSPARKQPAFGNIHCFESAAGIQ